MHTNIHLARAVMEGVSYSLNSACEVLKEVGVETSDMAVCGGGAKSKLWRGMIADVYGIDVKTIQSPEAPALGVAILAGVAAGIYSSVEEGCEKTVFTKETVPYSKENHEEYKKFYGLYKKLYYSLKDDFKALNEIK